VLIDAGIAISMDGKGSWRDNVFVERLWRSIKCKRRLKLAITHIFDQPQGRL
jgi:transposase InsO family protein